MPQQLHISPLSHGASPPYELLDLADPNRDLVKVYLESGSCHVAYWKGELVGVLVLCDAGKGVAEVKNIAVAEAWQGKGFGKAILLEAEKLAVEAGFQKLRIATGNSSIGQLALYQKTGFEMVAIKRDFFLRHYPKPIFENGIQCKHQVVLEKALN